MKFDLPFLKMVGASVIAYTLIFFISIRIFNNSNNMKKSLFSLIVGGGLIFLNLVGLGIDYLLNGGFTQEYIAENYKVFAFPIVAVIYTIVIPLIFFVLGKKRNQSIKNDFKYYSKMREKENTAYDKEAKQTVIDEVNYLYLNLKFEDKFLLKEVINNGGVKEYSGLIVKFTKGENFHDDFVNQVIKSLGLDVNDYNLSGKAFQNKDKKQVYYIYTINLNSITEKVNDLVQVSPVVLYGYNLNNFNKQILFRLVLREYFEIEL